MEIKGDAWRKFIDEAMRFDGDTNFRVPFETLTRKYGQAYIEFCRCMWTASDGSMSQEEFARMNHMPASFFEKTIMRG